MRAQWCQAARIAPPPCIVSAEFVHNVQVPKYETAPNFIQLTQNLTLFVDLAAFT